MNELNFKQNGQTLAPPRAVSSAAPADDPRVIEALEEYSALLKEGRRPRRADFVARYPDVAEALAGCLEGLDLIHGVASELSADASTAPADDTLSGTLGDFRILREIGRGGMGVVYEAEQISLGRRVALKVLPFAATMDKRQLQRFTNEARAAACLHHPNIVPVHAVGCERGVHYYAMQFIEGQSLEALLQTLREDGEIGFPHAPREENPHAERGEYTARTPHAPREEIPHAEREEYTTKGDTLRGHASTLKSSKRGREDWRRVAELALQAAEALEHAHQSGVIHRDIKPANLLLDDDANLWITDFGLAHVASDTRLTMTGDLVGTLRYMSPEQALAKRVIVDHRTDIYSLGATFYEMLTLKPVFPGQDRQELLRQIAFEEPVAPRRLDRSIPVELETVILKALEKNPADRYGWAKEVADDLKRFLNDEPTLARRPTLWQRGRKCARRHAAAVRAGAAALFVVFAVVAGTAGWWLREQAEREGQTAKAVDLSLEESLCLQRERKTPEALAKVKQAETILASGVATAALTERVQARLADLMMVSALEEIGVGGPRNDRFARESYVQVDQNYAQLFRAYGIDVERTAPEEAARWIRSRTVAIELAAALDDWAFVVRRVNSPQEPRAKRLLCVARLADPDPFRNQLRQALENRDRNGLLAYAAMFSVSELPLSTVIMFALALEAAGETEKGIEVLRIVQQDHPGDFQLTSTLAAMVGRLRPVQWEEVSRLYTACAALRPESATVHVNLGRFFLYTHRIDEAIAACRKAIRIKHDYAEAHDFLGRALADSGQVEEGISFLRMAIRLNANDVHAQVDLAFVLDRSEAPAEAVAILRQAVSNNHRSGVACYTLGEILANSHDLEIRNPSEAVIWARKAVEIAPAHDMYQAGLGLALYRNREFELALESLNLSIKLEKTRLFRWTPFVLAMTHSQLGDRERARLVRQGCRVGRTSAGAKHFELSSCRPAALPRRGGGVAGHQGFGRKANHRGTEAQRRGRSKRHAWRKTLVSLCLCASVVQIRVHASPKRVMPGTRSKSLSWLAKFVGTQ